MEASLKNLRTLVLVLAALSGMSHAQSSTPPPPSPNQLDPGKLVEEAYGDAFLALQKGTAEIKMEIKKGSFVKEKTLLFKSRRGSDGLLMMMIKMMKKGRVQQSFLVKETGKGKPARQWSYLSSVRRVKEVSAGKAAGSFFGSDFINADLLPQTGSESDAELKFLDDAKVQGQNCSVVEIKIKKAGSPYGKIVIHISKEEGRKLPVKVTFFDPKLKPFKEMSILKTVKLAGVTTAAKLIMKRLGKKRSTTIEILKPNPDAVLKDNEFTKNAMQRGN